MRSRRFASIAATVALAAGVGLAIVVATPSIAAVVRTAHLVDAPSASGTRSSAPPAVPDPTPTVRYRGPLLAPVGWADITRAQLHAYLFPAGVKLRYPDNAAISERQEWIVKQCMAARGFLYDPLGNTDNIQTLAAKERDAFYIAEYGPETKTPYDWRTAGCHGRAVHETGQDNVH